MAGTCLRRWRCEAPPLREIPLAGARSRPPTASRVGAHWGRRIARQRGSAPWNRDQAHVVDQRPVAPECVGRGLSAVPDLVPTLGGAFAVTTSHLGGTGDAIGPSL